MDYLLIILSGVLGVIGVLVETHKTLKTNGRKVKRINNWGIFTVTSILSIIIISIYKQLNDGIEIKRINNENQYLKLAQFSIGPYYIINISFEDSIFSANRNLKEKEFTKQLIASNRNFSLPDSLSKAFEKEMKPYYNGFLDSASLSNLFYFNSFSNWERATIDIEAGVIDAKLDFQKNGIVNRHVSVSKSVSSTIENIFYDTTKIASMSIESKKCVLLDKKNNLTVVGQFDSQINAGKIFGSIMRQHLKSKDNFSGFVSSVYDIRTDDKLFILLNQRFNRVKKINMQITYDADAFRWFVIPLEFDNDYKVEIRTIDGIKKKFFFKNILMTDLPSITDITSED